MAGDAPASHASPQLLAAMLFFNLAVQALPVTLYVFRLRKTIRSPHAEACLLTLVVKHSFTSLTGRAALVITTCFR